jgi:hypothetical protein
MNGFLFMAIHPIIDLGMKSCQIMDVFFFAGIPCAGINAEINVNSVVAELIGCLGGFGF